MLATHVNIRGRRPALFAVAGSVLGHAARCARRVGIESTPVSHQAAVFPPAESAIAERPVIPCTESVGSAVATSLDTMAPALGLTRRERQVLQLLVEGQTDPQIADRLCISPRTASWHVGRILAKLGAPSRTYAAIVAVRLGLA